ncbi:MAG: MgtC/SapB family protein [Muribaculaceae bacterium]|nr:MgtC/SapB family protein [Muribaculaceae bacterium]
MIQYFESLYESLNSLDVSTTNSIFRLILSMALGMIIGAERKRKGQIAGVRTFALISMGACLAMLLSIYVPQEYLGLKNGDPGRIAAQVITGIGFIGGGAMIHLKGAVKGLTTAAGIWMTAIIGMAVGIGMYIPSIAATALILITLVALEQYEKHLRLDSESKVINLSVEGIISDIQPYRQILADNSVQISTFFIEYDYAGNSTQLNFVVLARSHSPLLPVLNKISSVHPTKRLSLSSQLAI